MLRVCNSALPKPRLCSFVHGSIVSESFIPSLMALYCVGANGQRKAMANMNDSMHVTSAGMPFDMSSWLTVSVAFMTPALTSPSKSGPWMI